MESHPHAYSDKAEIDLMALRFMPDKPDCAVPA